MGMSAIFQPVRAWLCACVSSHGALTGCCAEQHEDPSAAALWMLFFGCWMVVVGAAFILIPRFGGKALLEKVREFAAALGFPPEAGVWSEVFGVALTCFGLFYFAAALFEVRTFFWMSIFGRLGVFKICVVLSWRHQLQENGRERPHPNKLLLVALPDLITAVITAWIMLPDYLARAVFLGGVVDLTVALGFFTFPEWLVHLMGVRAKADTWNIVLGSLCAFFGTYSIAAAMLGLEAINWVAFVARIFMIGALILTFCFRKEEISEATPGSQPPSLVPGPLPPKLSQETGS